MSRPSPFADRTRDALPRGAELLRDPTLNKGTAFSAAERDALGLRGLLPPHVATQDEQVARILENFHRVDSDLSRYIMLESLQDRNETLFFRVIMEHPDEMLPVIYTPTVGLACQQYGHIFRRSRGLYISAADRGRVADILANWSWPDAAMIVVTDGERILGLGDLGANGMGIPIGKLALYTALAGLDPRLCLPVLLDVGTNNAALRDDPLYVGLRQPRATGDAYDGLVDEFVLAVQARFPRAVIQFEDFANHNAFRLLQRYRDRCCCFNDDIQGTAAVSLAGLLAALRVTGRPLADQRILCFGAGEAAAGICDLLVSELVAGGMAAEAARERCWMFDSKGLVVAGRDGLAAHKRPYAHAHPDVRDFLACVRELKPTAILGAGATPHVFTREVIGAMALWNERPIVFALSNPTSQSECTAEEAYAWSDGRALFASGSPFAPVTVQGRRHVPGQANNAYIFPGLGLGLVVVGATRVTDRMFRTAARTLAEQVTEDDLRLGSLFPPLAAVREVSAHIAAAVAKVAIEEGVATHVPAGDLTDAMRAAMYEPRYRSYV